MAKTPMAIVIAGDKEIEAALFGLARQIREVAIPRALKNAGAEVVKAARKLAPEDISADPSGTLKKSLGLVLRGRRNRPRYVVIGARKGFSRPVRRPIIIRGVFTGYSALRKADPANYAHLVEFGHFVVVPKSGTSIRKGNAILAGGKSYVPARPFLRPAFTSAIPAVRNRLIVELAKEQARYLNRKAKRTGRLIARALFAA